MNPAAGLSTRPDTGWWVLGASVRGSAHVRGDLPNQDSFGWTPQGPHLASGGVLAVADGHGSPSSYRSEEGAAAAVEIALGAGAEFLARHRGDPPDALRDALRSELGPAVVERWQARMLEVAEASDDPRLPRDRFGRLRVFGSTVIVAVLADRAVGLLQLGDGDAVLLGADGAARRGVEDDPRLRFNLTTSLCMPDAVAQIRFAAVARRTGSPRLVMLSTDGYSNSFADGEGFLAVGPDLWDHLVERGPEFVAEQFGSWLAHSAEVGGDDVTLVAAFVDPVAAATSPARVVVPGQATDGAADTWPS